MKKFSFLKYSALCLVALFSVAVMSSCDKNDEPDRPGTPGISGTPEIPETLEYPKVLNFDGAFFAGINRISLHDRPSMYSVTYKDFDKYGIPNLIDIYYRFPKSKTDDVFNIVYNNNFFDDASGDSSADSSFRFTTDGCMSFFHKEKHESVEETLFSSKTDSNENAEFAYQDGNRLSEIKTVSVSENSSIRWKDSDHDIVDHRSWTKTTVNEDIQLTWDNNNIVKITKVVITTSERLAMLGTNKEETTDVTVYDIEYDTESFNESRQYPFFVSEFIMNSNSKYMLPMIGVLGVFSKNMPVSVKVTENDNLTDQYNVAFSKILINGFNVISSETYNKETFQYLYK